MDGLSTPDKKKVLVILYRDWFNTCFYCS